MNINIKRILYSPYSSVMLSFLIGFGIASLFRRSCKNKNCLKFVAPTSQDLYKKTYKFNNKCYKFSPNMGTCSKSKTILNFA